jgi:hypothetical protein
VIVIRESASYPWRCISVSPRDTQAAAGRRASSAELCFQVVEDRLVLGADRDGKQYPA